MTEPITRKDLEEVLDKKFEEHSKFEAEQHINIMRIIDNHQVVADKHEKIFHGHDGRTGLVRDVNEIKTTGRLLKWWATIGGASGFGAAIKHFFGGY